MQQTGDGQERRFARWLRTGRLPMVDEAGGIEHKANPWHDREDGRFTSAGAGLYAGGGQGGSSGNRTGRTPPGPAGAAPTPSIRSGTQPNTAAKPARNANWSNDRARLEAQRRQHPASAPPAPARGRPAGAEFVAGVGEGLYDTAVGTAKAVYATATTNPVTTLRQIGRGIAATIDTAIAAEDVPARVQISRAADAVANASARDVGRVVGSVAANGALAALPGATALRLAKLRRLKGLREQVPYRPLPIEWVKENLGKDKPWITYNNGTPGARPGLAPALLRTMPDGSVRKVKFDGLIGDYIIDRKTNIVTKRDAKAQALRQSDVLAQHDLPGTWAVPTKKVQIRARRALKKWDIKNIKVRIEKP